MEFGDDYFFNIFPDAGKPKGKRFEGAAHPPKLVSQETIPENVINEATASGLAGEWEGFVKGSIIEVDLPNGLGDAWGTSELCPEGTLRICYFHVKHGAIRRGLGSLLLKMFAATAKESLGYKRLIGTIASDEAVMTFLRVFGGNVAIFTDDTGKQVSGERALEIRRSVGGRKLDVEVDLDKFDSTGVARAKLKVEKSE